MTQAVLNFQNRDQAQHFATSWAFYSLRGYSLGAGMENVKVELSNVSEEDKLWINEYCNNLNSN